jgi:hypothetical protein
MNINENIPQVLNNSLMPSAQEFQMLQVISKNAQDSGLYSGVGQQSKIFMVLLAARELGVSPCLALNGGIWNIQGKIEISARLMNALIRRAGHSIKIVVSNDTHCTLLGTRTDGDSFECSFNMDDATKAGLSGGNVWKKYPADMLYNRCMSRLARRLFSDVIGNSYVEGEIREAKDIERLEKAECEDITQKQTINQFENVSKSNNEKPNISFDHLTEILKGMAQMPEDVKENYKKYMKTTWNVSEYEYLPEEAFEPTMKAIERVLNTRKNNDNNTA